MRLIFTSEMEKAQQTVDPYIVLNGTDVTYKEGTPQEIIELHKNLIRTFSQMLKEAALA